MSDYFTKWIEAIPLPSKCGHDVQDSLLSSEFHQNNTFTVNYNFQSTTLIYFPITISHAVSPILPTSLPSLSLNSSPVTLISGH